MASAHTQERATRSRSRNSWTAPSGTPVMAGTDRGQLADAGAVVDQPGTGEQADAHASRSCSDPGQRVTQQAAADRPLACADDRARDQAPGNRCDGIIDPPAAWAAIPAIRKLTEPAVHNSQPWTSKRPGSPWSAPA